MKTVTRRDLMQYLAAGACLANGPLRSFAEDQSLASALKAHDHAVHIFSTWLRDPMITAAQDGFFYCTGTTSDISADSDTKNGAGESVRVWRSSDLSRWESLGAIVSIRDTASYKLDQAIFNQNPESKWHVWAPELHQRKDGRWGLVFTVPPPLRPRIGAALLLSDTSDLKGPWSNPMGDKVGLRHDPSLFCDDDGTWWMIWGNTAVAPLKPDWSDYASAPVPVHPSDAVALGHEGCTILKIKGRYVLFGTGWSTSKWRKGSYNLYYATADKITGPYGKRKFLGRFLGHGTPFMDKQGRWWCTAFPNANTPPLPVNDIEKRNLANNAQTINQEGLTLVPLSVRKIAGDVEIRAIDPHYSTPGPDEAPTWTGAVEIY